MTRKGRTVPHLEAAVATVQWLTSPAGRSAVAAATASFDRGRDALAVGEDLRRGGLDADRSAAAAAAAAARRRARERWPDADRLLFLPRMLEQASDPAVAGWRAERFAAAGAEEVWDLCSGAGGDSLALAQHADVVALDHDIARLLLLGHNAAARGLPVRGVATDVLRPGVRRGRGGQALVHVDPSRRAGDRRVHALASYQPPLPAILEQWGDAAGLAAVVSPGVDLDDPDLPGYGELEFVQVERGLVEAVWWSGALERDHRSAGRATTATLLPQRLQLHGPASSDLPVRPIGAWLLEVAPAAVRARCHTAIGAEAGAARVAHTRALLTTDGEPGPSPWWQRWRVEAVLPPRPRHVRRWLVGAPALPLTIAVHGVEADPKMWWRALGRPPRGPQGRRLHLVRTDDGARCVATEAVDEGAVRIRS